MGITAMSTTALAVPMAGRDGASMRGFGWMKKCMGLSAVFAMICVAALQPLSASPAAAATSLSSSVATSVSQAVSQGITQYVSIVDRTSGKVVYSTANASTQVASESIVKLYIAVWWLHQSNGDASAVSCGDIGYMIRDSDDDTATSCWRQDILSDVSNWYGLGDSSNNPGDWTYWGAARISATDVATLLYRAANDPLVGDWLTDQMLQTSATGSDGYDQDFGFRAVDGAASKQGWDQDGYWLPQSGMIHSAGYVGNLAAVVLQMGDLSSQEDLMHTTATNTAQTIASNAHPTSGTIGTAYQQLGGLTSELGFPTSDQTTSADGGTEQNFQKGAIYWTAATGAHAVLGTIEDYWTKVGGTASSLGYPDGPQTCDLPDGSCWQSFTGGTLVAHSGDVSFVPTALADQWTAQRDVLGVPSGNATTTPATNGKATITQHYAGGTLSATVASRSSTPATVIVTSTRPGFWASVRKGAMKVIGNILARI